MNHENRIFEPHVRDLNPKVVFEFGSYDLSHGVYYKRLWPKAAIYCFEPNPELFDAVKDLADKEKINFYQYAISDKEVWMKFYPSKFLDGKSGPSGSLLKHTEHTLRTQKKFQSFPKSIKVRAISIKNFCQEHRIKKVDFMHIDVEGAVIDVFNGFGDIRPKIIRVKVHDRDILFKNAPSTSEVNNLKS